MPSTATDLKKNRQDINKRLFKVRHQSELLCQPLIAEDYVVQPVVDVSPPKWHLAHTAWFFENFVLVPYMPGYKLFHKDYSFLFNSYYVGVGARWQRQNRGDLSRPGVKEIYDYRHYVDQYLEAFLKAQQNDEVLDLCELGIQHEQQHQELLLYDIKYILGQNPLFPVYSEHHGLAENQNKAPSWLHVEEGPYHIGFDGCGFHFDNEEGRHKVFLHEFEIGSRLVTNGQYLEFLHDGGYQKTALWLSEGWDWLCREGIESPLYWIPRDGGWHHYTLQGLKELDLLAPVAHLSFYEADAFARWKGVRLPTEFEWEAACQKYEPAIPDSAVFVEDAAYQPVSNSGYSFYGNLWEWTASSYRPYPFYNPPSGAIGEYNGKFMSGQMVLRGGSFGTPGDHIRPTYRNFFHPHAQWLFSGLRLSRHTS